MIAKQVPMKSLSKSDFGELVAYITDSQSKQERVGYVAVANCQSIDPEIAALEVINTQAQNTRAEADKTYHLIVSFRAGEQVSDEVLAVIESRICDGLGFGEHQRVSAVHHDTDNLHLHIAINKIHPTRYTIHAPYNDHKTLGKLCEQLEREFGLERDNHAPVKTASENRVADMERHAGIESLVSWVRRECADQIKTAQTWGDLHKTLAEHGLQIQAKGNGFVLASQDGVIVKASTVDRSFSRAQLEARLGQFAPSALPFAPDAAAIIAKRPPVAQVGRKPPPRGQGRLSTLGQLGTVVIGAPLKVYDQRPLHKRISTAELHARYKAEQAGLRDKYAQGMGEARRRRDRAIEAAKRTAALKRAALKMTDGKEAKKFLRSATSSTLKEELAKIRAEYAKDRQKVIDASQRMAWADWLRKQATEGEGPALLALRAREAAQALKGNTVSGKRTNPLETAGKDSITKKGTVIFRAGKTAVRDDGERLSLTRGASHDGLVAALRMAMERFGETVTVNGSAEFKERVAIAAVAANLPIRFDDPALEARRLVLKQQAQKEFTNGRPEPGSRPRQPQQLGARSGLAAGAGRGTGSPAIDGRSDSPSNGLDGRPVAGINGHRPSNGRDGSAGGRVSPTHVRLGAVNVKPGIAGIGRKPPPQSQNRLRSLSQLGVVHLAHGGEVLLPGDVPRNVGNQGAQPDHGVRRDLSGTGGLTLPRIVPTVLSPAQKYIAEREGKRQQGFDIPKHRTYNEQDAGALAFAGLRQVEGQSLALLRKGDEVTVLAIDQAAAQRLKRLSVGDLVTVSATGAVKKKGRSL